MTSVRLSVSLPQWVVKEIIGESENVSGRIEELVIKGYMAQRSVKKENVVSRMPSRNPATDRFISLMLSGHCTQDRGFGQVYAGMGVQA